MSYNCNVGSGSSGSSSGSSDYDYGSSSSSGPDDYDFDDYDFNNLMSGGSMSGGAPVLYDAPPESALIPASPEDALIPYDAPPERAGISIEEIYTGVPTPQAYRRVKSLLDSNSFTEDVNVVYANDLIIEFSENSSGKAVLRMQGSNADLMDEITLEFN
jgi:hypothetical protein